MSNPRIVAVAADTPSTVMVLPAVSAFVEDVSASLDFIIDWTAWLQAGETISTVTWSIVSPSPNTTPPLVVGTTSNTTTAATVWLSGGTDGTEYQVKATITTSATRKDARSFYLVTLSR